MANTLTNSVREIVGGTVFLTQWAVKQKLDKFPESSQKSHLLHWTPFLQSLLCLKTDHISLPAVQEKSLSGLISFVEIGCWKHIFLKISSIIRKLLWLVSCCWFFYFNMRDFSLCLRLSRYMTLILLYYFTFSITIILCLFPVFHPKDMNLIY